MFKYNVGDLVRVDGGAQVGPQGPKRGEVCRIVADESPRTAPYRLRGSDGATFVFHAYELEAVSTATQPEASPDTTAHDYMLGYADGFRHPAGDTPVDSSDSADYRAGFVDGWDASVAEDRADMLAQLTGTATD